MGKISHGGCNGCAEQDWKDTDFLTPLCAGFKVFMGLSRSSVTAMSFHELTHALFSATFVPLP